MYIGGGSTTQKFDAHKSGFWEILPKNTKNIYTITKFTIKTAPEARARAGPGQGRVPGPKRRVFFKMFLKIGPFFKIILKNTKPYFSKLPILCVFKVSIFIRGRRTLAYYCILTKTPNILVLQTRNICLE